MHLDDLALHFHDTYGQAPVQRDGRPARRRHDVRRERRRALGGCPYAKSATGNLATEDLVWLSPASASSTASTSTRLVATSTWLADHLGRPSPSAVVRALSG
jgi:hydroxymethylglutaryl-CoA lyase